MRRVQAAFAVDEKSKKLVSFRITKGNVHDTKKFGPLVKGSANRHDIDNIYGEKAYDNRNNFNIPADINAEPAITILLLEIMHPPTDPWDVY